MVTPPRLLSETTTISTGALDELVARVAAAFDGGEQILDADEEQQQSLIESRVADVTRSVLGKLGFDDDVLKSLEDRLDAISEEQASAAAERGRHDHRAASRLGCWPCRDRR